MSTFHLGAKFGSKSNKMAQCISECANKIAKEHGLNIYDSNQILWVYDSIHSDNIKFLNEHGVCLCEIKKA